MLFDPGFEVGLCFLSLKFLIDFSYRKNVYISELCNEGFDNNNIIEGGG